ncbi:MULTISPECIES: hypothetical protein [unclassified Pseudofrankia]|uniref:hypothetical protein n=1 Tax=unclassified Pseudofrankia TaxID=2994372 RepID=UPI0008DA210F|nr:MULTISPECIES: hypothetical protein [unclassified Pseudofrankia]MDT3440057.1 hypothetical protein [Pseudofrankia sp. BMG5.37]OHV44682.1 hypothetical protein BCD48_24630 [Pseudofrankia sp. BMG5.36]
MNTAPPLWIHDMLSAPRFARYLQTTNGDAEQAMRLYWWNVEVSAAFYGPLHCLELALRNSMNTHLRARYGVADWWTVAPLSEASMRKVNEVRASLAARRSRPRRADDVVAALTFGFWVSLLSRSYDRHLWVPVLNRAFPRYSGRRDQLHDNFLSMQLFRNRIMHHEPIHHRDLIADHAKIYRLIGYISPNAAQSVAALDRVPDVLARRHTLLNGSHRSSF